MQLLARENRESYREYALRTITHNIVHLELEPGARLSEGDLSEQLGISRTPVREALLELAKSGIVEILPQRCSQVSYINYEFVEEIRFHRLVLERAVVELACNLADGLDFKTLDENLRLQQFCLQNGWSDRLLDLDDAFHRELFRLCGKERTFELMRSWSAHFDRVRALALRLGPVRDTKTVDDHLQIAQAIQSKDKPRAVDLMTSHLTRYQYDAVQIRERFPAYFQ